MMEDEPISFLPQDEPRLICSYTEVFSGFAAKLTEEEVSIIQQKDALIRVYRDRLLPLATTHSPEFLGLRVGNGFWNVSGLGKGVIIGVLDTGLLPTHPSFGDDGVPPPPRRWKGRRREAGHRAPPVDDAGHGTHTASTAAGNFVADASVRGNANGTAAGIAPHAHLAIYKVCSRSRCSMVDILAGLDAAVKDGVDVVSLSLGGGSAPFEYDPIAIAAFKAMEKGIFVSCAAATKAGAELCLQRRPLGAHHCSFLDNFDIEGKIVLCQSPGLTGRIDAGIGVLAFGGAGMILMNPKPDGYTTFADAHVLPASHVSYAAGSEIISYVNSTSAPTATIAFEGTVLGSSPAPTVAFFSSRGPGKASPGIIKPDVTGPGMNILAAWAAPAETRSTMAVSTERAFNMVSGTSMSTPHLSGVAALIKSVHPHWSPAAIKSAIMTTSDFVDHSGEPIKNEQYQKASFFAMGAGYVNPSRAVDPGLVYDLGVNDYIAYLCGLGLGDAGVSAVAHRNIRCSTIRNVTEAELNYPSILVNPQDKPITVKRTVTNVGKASSTYVAAVEVPEEVVVVRVRPRILHFSKANEKKSFAVTVQRKGGSKNGVEGNLKWVSGEHVVRSPILIPAKSSASFATAFAVNS
ncbi:Subtilisin-like protease SBT1.6 [Ananas comosus]|uniref:Subtilisin-like protease SBT1.6 n=1 Tax=Ananas comosus TaxID=4615 RepID=A0A199VKN3_ANACO|nr:Subtilisin-like protease SBT1.6 [Ananas comosus]